VFALGLAAALVASALFNVGLVLQALEARATPRVLGLRLSLLVRLFRRPRWVLGLLLGAIGIAPQVLALAEAPFVVVQPALTAGLLLLLALGSRMLDEPVGVVEVVGVAAIIGGIALVAWGAPPHSEAHRGGAAVIAVMAGLSALALAPFAARDTRLDSAMLAIVGSGGGFAASNVATKLMSDDVHVGHFANAVPWAAVGLATGVAATVSGMTAFQRRRATTVVPVSTSVQTYLPIVLEPLFLRERWSSAELGGAPIFAGVAVALLGTVLVSRSRAVSELAAASIAGQPDRADRDQRPGDEQDERGDQDRRVPM
jgi:drug/metabolite transporter (DMT)-like permease